MTDRRIRSPRPVPASDLAQLLLGLEKEFEVPAPFDEATLAAAEAAVANLVLPAEDATGIPFFTIDPEGATDLDQAMYLEKTGDGYIVNYAIADVPAFVELGGALDQVARDRGQTYYLPHRKITLHPPLISEDQGSLLPEQIRPAFHWKISLDQQGALGAVELKRVRIKSRAQLDYATAQRQLDGGSKDEQLALLAEIGALRIEQERLRGGASLNLPDQEIEPDGDGYRLVSRVPLPLEDHNAQISLLTGIAAARLMLDSGVGILRTMPQPEEQSLQEFRAQTQLLGQPWDEGISYGQYLHALDVSDPKQLVIMHRAASLFRGADYHVINGQPEAEMIQAALAAPYAHTTAPLRRLVDRFVLLTCHLLTTGESIPDELKSALEQLPALMRESSAAANRVNRASLDLMEAYVLQSRVGEQFHAIILQGQGNGQGKASEGQLQLVDLPVTASFTGTAEPGSLATVKLVHADPQRRRISFEIVAQNS
ncbi:RNB domain-containing ribonuclease [Glutamicibacter sp. FBE19]|uniref:RNB domain-containing ribonuclease n=1 Tax=Glutamicibacter sp. FBE19 TaxID=2761534 RepID=UPI0018965AE7|nr:RNB domain-containing ribonuclease [Glutamicibacter sp. FBE19]